MSWIGTFSTLQGVDIQRSNNISESILEHGPGAQQQMIKSALEKGLPCLERWKLSIPARILDPQADSVVSLRTESQGSSKSPRLA